MTIIAPLAGTANNRPLHIWLFSRGYQNVQHASYNTLHAYNGILMFILSPTHLAGAFVNVIGIGLGLVQAAPVAVVAAGGGGGAGTFALPIEIDFDSDSD
jgi:hypothetical protein